MPWSELPVPRSEGDLTVAWFSETLRLQGLVSVSFEALPGLLNPPLRASFSYSAPGDPRLQSVVVKMGGRSGDRSPGRTPVQAPRETPLPHGRGPVDRVPVTDREFLFYRDFAPHFPVAVPKVLFSLVSSDGHFVLVLEDLLLRDGIRPFEAADLPLAVEALGRRLHTAYWRSVVLEQHAYLRPMADFIERVDGRLSAGVPRLLQRLGGEMDASLPTLFGRLPGGFRPAAEPLAESPPTLCHHDLCGRNLFVQGAGANREVVFIDWQLVQAVPGVRDLSFLIGSECAALAEPQERGLLERYHRGLVAEGVAGYGFDRLLEDYRRSIICDLGRIAMTASNAGLAEEMWEQLAMQLRNRADAVERWGLLELL